MRTPLRLAGIALLAACAAGDWRPTAYAADLPVVLVSPDGVTPARLEVHLGEIVVWRSTTGERLRVQLDDHPAAHEAAEGVGEVVGVFRRGGSHQYLVRLLPAGRPFRGAVLVREGKDTDRARPNDCIVESDRICFAR